MSRKITGIILSGGKSSRMGKEKGLCLFKGKKLVQYAIDVLSPYCERIIIVANNKGYENLGLEVFSDEVKEIGPVGGIYTGLVHSKTEDNFILSCDMPMISQELVEYLLQNIKNKQIVVPEFGGFFEPLCAYYRSDILQQLKKLIEERNYKLVDFIRKTDFAELRIDKQLDFFHPLLFANINSEKEIEDLGS
jgi:molybdopterin-guanine dinucleotide biosynthesis protein A